MSVHPIKRKGDTRPRCYETRWREGSRQRSRRFCLKADAEVWDREVRRRQELGPLAVKHLTGEGPTLSEWIAQRWAPEHGAQLEQSTLQTYA